MKYDLQLLKDKNYRTEVLFTFFFKDLAFLLLPLLILFPISVSMGGLSLNDFFSSTDFSFVVVVLSAMTVTDFIELKTKIQKSINYKLFEGLKLFIIILIASSIALTINLLSEFKVLNKVLSHDVFCIINFVLFFLGAFSLFLTIMIRVSYKYHMNNIHYFNTKSDILEIIQTELESINQKLMHSNYTLDHFKIDNLEKKEVEYSDYQKRNEEKIGKIMKLFSDNKELLEMASNKLTKRQPELK
jgi:hypothetical protein